MDLKNNGNINNEYSDGSTDFSTIDNKIKIIPKVISQNLKGICGEK